jgi:hypothetical protein
LVQGGAVIFLGGGTPSILRVYVAETIFSDCGADGAAVIYADYGGWQLSNGTFFRNITGVAIFVGDADVVYLLPAPAGHYVPAASVVAANPNPQPTIALTLTRILNHFAELFYRVVALPCSRSLFFELRHARHYSRSNVSASKLQQSQASVPCTELPVESCA